MLLISEQTFSIKCLFKKLFANPILTIVDLKDAKAANIRHRQLVDARHCAEQVEYVIGLFGSYLLSAFLPWTYNDVTPNRELPETGSF